MGFRPELKEAFTAIGISAFYFQRLDFGLIGDLQVLNTVRQNHDAMQ